MWEIHHKMLQGPVYCRAEVEGLRVVILSQSTLHTGADYKNFQNKFSPPSYLLVPRQEQLKYAE